MKKSFKIIAAILLFLFITFAVYLIIKDVYDKKQEGKQLLEKYSDDDIKKYLNHVSMIFRGKSYTEFSDTDIISLLSIQLINTTPSTKEEVQKFIKKYFGIDNYDLKVGTYKSELLDTDIIISYKDGKYKADYPGKGMGGIVNSYNHKEIQDDYLVVYYDYVKILEMGPNARSEKIGDTKIYLKIIDNNLTIEKIEYTEI